MAHKVIHESKHIFRRVAIGAVTGVLGTVILYFLYNRNPKASEAEIRKNTIQTWKTFTQLENETQAAYDSSWARMSRNVSDDDDKRNKVLDAFCTRDSLTSLHFMRELKKLAEQPALDPDIKILLNARMAYQDQQLTANLHYTRRLQALMDSSLSIGEINETASGWQKLNTERQSSITLRIGRNIEYFIDVLSRKYKYPFSFTDINYYPRYMVLKREKEFKMPDGVAPPDPNQPQADQKSKL